MTIDEVILSRQIDMNNGWNKEVPCVETEALMLFKDRIGNEQILYPMVIDKEKTFFSLQKDKHLAKIFSSVLDVYDTLPYHPDLAFDAAWRSLEYLLKYYAKKAWNSPADSKFDSLFTRFSNEVFASLIKSEQCLKDSFSILMENVSLSALKYMTVRLYFCKELSVAPQIRFVNDRAVSILGKNMIDTFLSEYGDCSGGLDTPGVRKIARRFGRLLCGDDVSIGAQTFKPIPLEDRIELLLSVVLYSSRCERFHGDIYSPLKSSKTRLTTYYEYYYLTLSSLFFFWVQMYKLIDREDDLEQFIDLKCIESSVISTINQMKTILKNE